MRSKSPYPPKPVVPNAFEEIDTHEKAYLLGFLMADGCVVEPRPHQRQPKYRIDLKIKSEDGAICHRLQNLTGGSLFPIENGYRLTCMISSDEIAADLLALGMVPRKTFTGGLNWDRIPKPFHGSVLAGLIDGDGHIRFEGKNRRAEISLLTASSRLRDQLLERFPYFKCVTVPPMHKQKNPLYRLVIESNRRQLQELIREVYANLPFPILERKQMALDAIKGWLVEADAYEQAMNRVLELKQQGMTIREIAAELGTSIRPIRARLEAAGVVSRRQVYTEVDFQLMKQLHQKGRSVLEIHRVLGKGTEQAVRHHLVRMGCLGKTRKPNRPHPMAQVILGCHYRNMTVQDIAEENGICPRVVSQVLRNAGVLLRAGSPQRMSIEKAEWAAGKLKEGRTIKSVAEELGVSGTLVRLWVQRLKPGHAEED